MPALPDADVLFSGDLIEYKSACYCGDAFLREWPETLKRLSAYKPGAVVPGRGDALIGREKVDSAIAGTTGFVSALYEAAERSVAKGFSLKEAYAEVSKALDGPYGDYAIYEHCLPFNVSRAYNEARGIAGPRIWTDERDLAMWKSLQD